jgi:tRNA pseudouridine38-40 synthase
MPMPRIALGLSYRGSAYQGWQSQPSGQTVQDHLESALARFADEPVRTLCAGRTDAGVHAINQVVHLDSSRERTEFSWLRGTNRFLPHDIAVQWCRPVDGHFHARNAARARRAHPQHIDITTRPAGASLCLCAAGELGAPRPGDRPGRLDLPPAGRPVHA